MGLVWVALGETGLKKKERGWSKKGKLARVLK